MKAALRIIIWLSLAFSVGVDRHLYLKFQSAMAQGLEESIDSELDNFDAGEAEAVDNGEELSLEEEGGQPSQPEESKAAKSDKKAQAPKKSEAKPDQSPEQSIGEPPPVPEVEPAAPRPEIARPEPSSPGADEPNFAFEKRVYRIFHDARPIPATKWDEMIGSRREDVYNVQAGDTLWDISQTLFGDGFYWSKLWAENRDVENPHRIAKGRNIHFVAGTEDEPPTVGVVDAQEKDSTPSVLIRVNSLKETKGSAPTYREQALKDLSPDELSNRTMVEVEELVPTPEMPPAKKSRPVTPLPKSFENPPQAAEDRRYDITGLDPGKNRSLTAPATVVATSYIMDHDLTGIGKIEEIDFGEKVASIGQYVFVRLNREARKNEKFSVLMPKGKVKDPIKGYIGPIVEVGGLVEITSPISEDEHTYRALVVGCVNPILVGGVLSSDPLPRANFARRGTRINAEVRIIGGELDVARKIIGESSVVYLDGGSRSGLSIGDIMPIQAKRGQRRENSKFKDWLKPIGLLKVIKVEESVATGVIIEAHEEIHTGDVTGGSMPTASRPIQFGN